MPLALVTQAMSEMITTRIANLESTLSTQMQQSADWRRASEKRDDDAIASMRELRSDIHQLSVSFNSFQNAVAQEFSVIKKDISSVKDEVADMREDVVARTAVQKVVVWAITTLGAFSALIAAVISHFWQNKQ